LEYTKTFDPPQLLRVKRPEGDAGRVGDRSDEIVYVFSEEIVLAVNIALAAQRPLLVSGDPGSGKSSLAAAVAAHMNWRYEPEVITPRTQASDLCWRFDALKRLRDAQAEDLKGVLWRAFEPPDDDRRRAVVLLDEIDKADPDVPNSLLDALGSMTFRVTETDHHVAASPELAPFVVITTNNERELPRPFLRRCIALALPAPDEDRLVEIAKAHGLHDDPLTAKYIAKHVVDLIPTPPVPGQTYPGAAEYLDALRACRDLGVAHGTDEWLAIASATLEKSATTGRS
jgi:MoxR-like ATPase